MGKPAYNNEKKANIMIEVSQRWKGSLTTSFESPDSDLPKANYMFKLVH
jgi:hypothetical protein